MNKHLFVFVVLVGLIAPQTMAVASDTSFGVGIGGLYSGLGVNVGLKSDNEFKYVSAGCLGAVSEPAPASGLHFACGVGTGWIWTSLLSNDNRNGFGLYAGAVDRDKTRRETRYGLGATYVYFPKGIGSGWNFGLTLAAHREDGSNRGNWLLNIGYQFQ